jgi:hypothetical protein
MNKKIMSVKYTIAYLNIPRLIFHILFYLKNKNICDSDIEVAFGCRNLKINCLAGLGGGEIFPLFDSFR